MSWFASVFDIGTSRDASRKGIINRIVTRNSGVRKVAAPPPVYPSNQLLHPYRFFYISHIYFNSNIPGCSLPLWFDYLCLIFYGMFLHFNCDLLHRDDVSATNLSSLILVNHFPQVPTFHFDSGHLNLYQLLCRLRLLFLTVCSSADRLFISICVVILFSFTCFFTSIHVASAFLLWTSWFRFTQSRRESTW